MFLYKNKMHKINSPSTPDWPNITLDTSKPVDLFVDNSFGFEANKDSIKILYIKEAEAINKMSDFAIRNHAKFDFILTYEDEVLNKCPNAVFMPFGTTWVHDYQWPQEKEFSVSHLTGHKSITDGHRMRQKVHYRQNKINVPRAFFISKFGGVENMFENEILGEEKTPLFDSQFHICIENSRQKNYFTEKIVDALITKTVPIYWGCPNIGDFFNLDGIIVVDSVDDLLAKVNSLTEETYASLHQAVEENYNKALGYADLRANLEEKLNAILKK